MGNLEDVKSQLLDEYSRNVEASTILAILSDYDLSDSSQLAAAREILDSIQASVPIEEESGFDPSGASGPGLSIGIEGSAKGENESVSARSCHGWQSQTDNTSLNQDLLTDLEGQDSSENGKGDVPERTSYPTQLDGLDDESKAQALIGIFPALKPFDIKWTLKKFKGDTSLVIDELMTQSFLEESGTRHRGVEAFSESESIPRKRKGKGKKRQNILTDDTTNISSSPGSPASPASSIQSKWDAGRQDVEFISSKTNMPMLQVNTIYHQNGTSIPRTISAIIEAHSALGIESDDPMVQITAYDIRNEFPTIHVSDACTLVQITHPSVNDAWELAKALSTPSAPVPLSTPFDFRHAPIDLDDQAVKTKPKAHNAINPSLPLDISSASALASGYRQTRDTAFVQASTAYRKGKSDPLMGGAAAYYSQIGRDADARARTAQSAAADAWVASQSSRSELDLHGVTIKDAVRITREKVTMWWHELSESRLVGRNIGGRYKVVTGRGLHSDGVGKLGPAVGKMLIREGWKIEVGTGHLFVTGISKR